MNGALLPATEPRSAADVRILVLEASSEAMRVVPSSALPTLFRAGDVLVVNDAATLPASLSGRTERGESVELRLVAGAGERRWSVVLFGEGDHHTRTEDRPPPPELGEGDRIELGASLVATLVARRPESPRLVDVELTTGPATSAADVWAAIYRVGKPVQYAHVPRPLELWDVQNVYAGRPWALEMPSAGRVLTGAALRELGRRDVEVVSVTHAAGLSSTGDPALDALLPLPEQYEVLPETWEAIARARARGGRVVAIGTSAARALEGGARLGTRSGITDLRIGGSTRRAVVDAVLTGVHEVDTSHFALLSAFADRRLLLRAIEQASSQGLLGHEFGDACLVWGQPREKLATRRGEDASAEASTKVSSRGGSCLVPTETRGPRTTGATVHGL
jgi:S-adenosylmethionine:tRNA ribosyltransferase-isomerase